MTATYSGLYEICEEAVRTPKQWPPCLKGLYERVRTRLLAVYPPGRVGVTTSREWALDLWKTHGADVDDEELLRLMFAEFGRPARRFRLLGKTRGIKKTM